jgi:hypothetical protein
MLTILALLGWTSRADSASAVPTTSATVG